MDRILLGVLIGALAASLLTVAFIWLAPFVALAVVVWSAFWLMKRARIGSGGGTLHLKPWQAIDPSPPALPPPTMADSFRPSGSWSRNWR